MHTTWADGEHKGAHAPLKEPLSADVVIVGGGMAGMMSAYMLSRAGKKVVLLEKGAIGDGVTSMTTAFITQMIDTGLAELVALFGAHQARLVMESGAMAIDTIQEIINHEHISCEFSRCPAYLYARTDAQFRKLTADHAAAQHLGLATTLVHKGSLPFKNTGYWEVLGQAKFQPLSFLQGLAHAATANGAQIFEHTPVTSVSDEGPVRVIAADGILVQADDVIVATYAPFNKPKAVRFKKAMYRSYVIQAHVPQTDLPDAIYWDQSNPYTYFRVDRHGAGGRIILGGADHRADIPMSTEKNLHVLEGYLKEIMSGGHYSITNRWHGPILESVDGLPFIGAYGPHRYLATAFSGNGMTYSVVAALMMADLVSGKTSPWTDVYDPKRKFTFYRLARKGMDYLGELLGGVVRNTFR